MLATLTLAWVPELLDQAATAEVTAWVSASPLEPIRTVKPLELSDVSDELAPGLLSGLPAKPEPHAVKNRAPVATMTPAVVQPRMVRRICVSWGHVMFDRSN